MPFETIAVRQARTYSLTAQTASVAVTPSGAFATDSLVCVVGCAVQDTGEAVLLSSVSGGSYTWQTPSNTRTADNYAPNVFSAYAMDVSSATPTITMSLSQPGPSRVSLVLLEIEKAALSSALDGDTNIGTSGSNATSTSSDATGALSQTDNMLVLACGGWFGAPSNPTGWTSQLTQENGAYIGLQVSTKRVTATTTQTGTVSHEATPAASAQLLVFKAAQTATLRYKFLLDSGTFTSADSSIPATVSSSLPGTCTEGQMHQDTDSLGTEMYVCTATNTWKRALLASW
jgi:hypothetical protein